MYIKVTAAKKAQAYIKNTNDNTYTLDAAKALHPGFNLLTLSFERNSTIKLGVNGVIVDTETPANVGILNTTLSVAIGAQKLVAGAASSKLKNAVVDDVFLAKAVISDQALWDIYAAYVIAAPLMLVEDTTTVQ